MLSYSYRLTKAGMDMLDTMNTVVSKLQIQIKRRLDIPANGTVAEIVKEILFEQFSTLYGLMPNWETFLTGGCISSDGGDVSCTTAALNSESHAPLWAMMITAKDKGNARSQWIYHIGIRETNPDDISLYYVLCHHDHLAGSIRQPRPTLFLNDPFPKPLFYDPRIACMCGAVNFPTRPQELSTSAFPAFVQLLRDDERTIPVMLISCPDVVSPDVVFDMALGNLIVYWTDAPEVIERLNAIMSDDLYTPWDSVRVILPLTRANAFHPTYLYEVIHQMGVEAFLIGIHQAYCSCLRSEESRSFITVADIARIRDRRQINALLSRINNANERMATLNEKLQLQQAEIVRLQSELKAYHSHPLTSEIKEYEELLNESFSENSALKQGIASLSTQLYASLGEEFRPDESEPIALLQELAHAIRTAILCASSKKK